MAEIKFDIQKTFGAISQSPKGWNKELNLISWNGKEPKYDLRDWAPEHDKMGKGVTLTMEELKALKDILNSMEL
ncbi:PC4/YdbC family ssDNA-binding protein [Paenibacillus sp. 102]|uniref:YdbC family protein n=1 Tax=Paenibacillus sp. 102 TaxID=3120823 RepID=UPI0031BBB3D1